MRFRDREKQRLEGIKRELFSRRACRPGIHVAHRRGFCLHERHAEETLHASVREQALQYFDQRRIHWRHGLSGRRRRDRPSNHLCCRQACTVNLLLPFIERPGRLAALLRALGYDAVEALPFAADQPLPDRSHPFVCFEWPGARNYLGEGRRGRAAADHERTRGRYYTSAAFAVRFLDGQGRRQVVLADLRYTEFYARDHSVRRSPNGTDRLRTYGAELRAARRELRLDGVALEALFYEPLYRWLRLYLLALEMERAREMEADRVTVLAVAAGANRELLEGVPRSLSHRGDDLFEVWRAIMPRGRFRALPLEQLVERCLEHGAHQGQDWRRHVELRYGALE